MSTGDKFIDGTETFKFSPGSAPETSQQVDHISNDVDDLRRLVDSHHTEALENHHKNAYEINVVRDVAQQAYGWIERFTPSAIYSTQFIAPVLLVILCSWPMRFLNWFFHWYSIQIGIIYRFPTPDESVMCHVITLTVDHDDVSWKERHREYKSWRQSMKKYGVRWKQLVQDSAKMMRQTEIRIP